MITFIEAIKTVTGKYAEFNGKASRPEFWWWILFTVLVTSALNVLNVISVGDNSSLGAILSGIWGIAVLLPTLAVTVRRLRDVGYNWTNIFWGLLPIAGAIILIIFLSQPKGSYKAR